jgi:hypothetical protein
MLIVFLQHEVDVFVNEKLWLVAIIGGSRTGERANGRCIRATGLLHCSRGGSS